LTPADQLGEARTLLASIRERVPGYALDDFMQAFRFDQAGESMFRAAARRLGLARWSFQMIDEMTQDSVGSDRYILRIGRAAVPSDQRATGIIKIVSGSGMSWYSSL